MRQLDSKRMGPAKGQAKNMVVFVHGYGASGADLFSLAGVLAPHMPHTVFYSPDAPLPYAGDVSLGRIWFPIPWLDGSDEKTAQKAMYEAADDLNHFLDQHLKEEDLADHSLALVGFSQGTMMSLHIGLRRSQAMAGVVGFSGRLLVPELIKNEARVKVPILLIHGDQDPVVPYESMDFSQKVLQDAGYDVKSYTMKGAGHEISPDGLGIALQFLNQHLNK